jgi:hypothetical protein
VRLKTGGGVGFAEEVERHRCGDGEGELKESGEREGEKERNHKGKTP